MSLSYYRKQAELRDVINTPKPTNNIFLNIDNSNTGTLASNTLSGLDLLKFKNPMLYSRVIPLIQSRDKITLPDTGGKPVVDILGNKSGVSVITGLSSSVKPLIQEKYTSDIIPVDIKGDVQISNDNIEISKNQDKGLVTALSMLGIAIMIGS